MPDDFQMSDNLPKSRNHRVKWTISEINFLEQNYNQMSNAEIGRALGRSVSSIQGMANKLGCRRFISQPWTEDEKQILRSLYETNINMQEICAMLPGRSSQSIAVMARGWGLSRPEPYWRQEEIDILRVYYPGEGKKMAVRLPGRGGEAVKLKANELGIKFLGDESYLVWSEAEWTLLGNNHLLPFSELCALFPHRSKSSVSMARRRFRRNRMAPKGSVRG